MIRVSGHPSVHDDQLAGLRADNVGHHLRAGLIRELADGHFDFVGRLSGKGKVHAQRASQNGSSGCGKKLTAVGFHEDLPENKKVGGGMSVLFKIMYPEAVILSRGS